MASITTFFGTQGGGGSVSGTATRIAFFGGTPGNPSTTLDDSANLEWDDTQSRLSVGDVATVGSTVTIAGATASDATSALEVRTSSAYGDLSLLKVYDNGRIDSRMLDSSEALTDNLSVGFDAGKAVTTGTGNSFYGFRAGEQVTSGSSNTLAGSSAGRAITNKDFSTLVGFQCGISANSEFPNTAVGALALATVTTGGDNVAVGSEAARYSVGPGYPTANPSESIYIGSGTIASSPAAQNEIVIGYGAEGLTDNVTVIGNFSTVSTVLRGDLYPGGDISMPDGSTIVTGSLTGTKIGATGDKLAFYGDTPDVQPDTLITGATVVHVGGAAVGASDTFGGYTIAQIAAALIRLGLLA